MKRPCVAKYEVTHVRPTSVEIEQRYQLEKLVYTWATLADIKWSFTYSRTPRDDPTWNFPLSSYRARHINRTSSRDTPGRELATSVSSAHASRRCRPHVTGSGR